ncbi:MarR family winged helix-turn-helix transcriptional regulator [Ruegeria hyattellae]|jgi:DNA-binding MarR family transcriptional regulator|uniref:MarR family winged helix-turn-helix transcriptional regulator n=1 Tax=Ruegeria hyattellae TaxID=3233337 RepID=UPI00355BACD0
MEKLEQSEETDYRLEDQIGHLLRRANQRHTAIFQAYTLEGLTPTQFAALARIAEQGSCSQNRLGRLAAMDVATIKGVVDRLQQKGLTIAEADPNDRRRTLISLSSAGHSLFARMAKAGVRISAETLKPLKSSEQRTFLSLLRKLT